MRSASLAEWILARFTTRERAASIVGDLLEAAPQKGKLWFWLSVTRIFLSLTWRRPLAYIAAYGVALCWLQAVQFSVFGVHAIYRLPETWRLTFHYLNFASACLSVGWAYMATRFGFGDSFARYLLAASALTVGFTFFGGLPFVALASGLLAACGFVYLVTSAERRKGLLALVIGVVFNFVLYGFSMPLYSLLGLVGTRIGFSEMVVILSGRPIYVNPIAPLWVFTVLSLLVCCFVYGRVHHMFYESNLSEDAQDPFQFPDLKYTNTHP
jgi:hypothetical protein